MRWEEQGSGRKQKEVAETSTMQISHFMCSQVHQSSVKLVLRGWLMSRHEVYSKTLAGATALADVWQGG